MNLDSDQNDPDNQQNQNNNQEQQAANAAKKRHQKSKNKFKNYQKKQAKNIAEATVNPALGITKAVITAVAHPIQTLKLIIKLMIIHMIIILVPILLVVALLFFIVMFFTTEDDNQCSQDNQSSDDTENVTGGTGGEVSEGPEMKKGSKEWKMFRETYAAAKKYGMDDSHAAACAGNADHESQHFELGWHVAQQGVAATSKTGAGIFQFNNEHSPANAGHGDWSPYGQVKLIMSQGGHPQTSSCDGAKGGLTSKSWMHESGSVKQLTEDFECSFEAGGDSDMSLRDGFAEQAYKMFKGVGGESDDADSTADSGSAACASASSIGGDTDDIIAFAKKYLGQKYVEGGGNPMNDAEGKPKSAEGTDCSGFVWAVLKHCGYKVTANKWATGGEKSFNGWKQVSGSDTKPGDVFVIGGDSGPAGHTGFLLEKWHGNNTKIINDGGRTAWNDVNIDKFGLACTSLLGSKPTFYQPEKK